MIDASKQAPHARHAGQPLMARAGLLVRVLPATLCLLLLGTMHLPAAAQTRAPTPPPVIGPTGSGDNGPAWLNHLLESLTPSVDTSLPESTRATAARLETQIGNGHAEQALAEIEQRLDAAKQKTPASTDVQLTFLKGRALNQLGRRDEAKTVYRQMTETFPELPEPWNNLAALEVADGQLEQAKTALEMAVRTDPNYAIAKENLGDLYMMLAARSYDDARKLAPQIPDAQNKRDGIKSLLDAPASQGGNRMTP